MLDLLHAHAGIVGPLLVSFALVVLVRLLSRHVRIQHAEGAPPSSRADQLIRQGALQAAADTYRGPG